MARERTGNPFKEEGHVLHSSFDLRFSMSLWTLAEKWNWVLEWNALGNLLKVKTVNEISKGIFSSVVIVWFLFQARDTVMSWGKAIQEGIHEQGIQRGREEGRREERKRWEESLKNQNVDPEIVRKARKFSDSSSKDR